MEYVRQVAAEVVQLILRVHLVQVVLVVIVRVLDVMVVVVVVQILVVVIVGKDVLMDVLHLAKQIVPRVAKPHVLPHVQQLVLIHVLRNVMVQVQEFHKNERKIYV